MNKLMLSISLMIALFLTACGGGGSNSRDNSPSYDNVKQRNYAEIFHNFQASLCEDPSYHQQVTYNLVVRGLTIIDPFFQEAPNDVTCSNLDKVENQNCIQYHDDNGGDKACIIAYNDLQRGPYYELQSRNYAEINHGFSAGVCENSGFKADVLNNIAQRGLVISNPYFMETTNDLHCSTIYKTNSVDCIEYYDSTSGNVACTIAYDELRYASTNENKQAKTNTEMNLFKAVQKTNSQKENEANINAIEELSDIITEAQDSFQ
jgi:hypothetical protein